MDRRLLASIFVFILLAFQPSQASAGVRVALIVANSSYKDAPLGNPTLDARLVEPALRAAGFEVEVVLDAGLERFDSAVASFAKRAATADIALFYFAGHGFAMNDGLAPRNYLMSTDAQVTSSSERVIKAGGIPMDEIVQRISASAKTTLIFVDACRNDPLAKRGVGGTRGLARVETDAIPNLFVAVSTRLGEQALDGTAGAGSPFAHAFAREIPRPGVRIDDAFAAVRKAVNEETGQRQKPEIVQDDLDAPLVLVSLPDAAPAEGSLAGPEPLPNPSQANVPAAASRTNLPGIGLGYRSITVEAFTGMNELAFSGVWVVLRDPSVDGLKVRESISFEITGYWSIKNKKSINFAFDLSDLKTIKTINPSFSKTKDSRDRLLFDGMSMTKSRWRALYRSMGIIDQRIVAAICRNLSDPPETNRLLEAVMDTRYKFWREPKNRDAVISLAKACVASIKDIAPKGDEIFVAEK